MNNAASTLVRSESDPRQREWSIGVRYQQIKPADSFGCNNQAIDKCVVFCLYGVYLIRNNRVFQ